jgi:hypothetical protein
MSPATISLFDPLAGLADAELAVLCAAALAGLLLVLQLFPDLSTGTGHGIFSLEVAWRRSTVREIVAAWRARYRDGAARRSLLTDLAFIVLYVGLLLTATALLAHAAGATETYVAQDVRTIVRWGSGAALLAGALDLLEDAGLLLALRGHTRQPIPALTALAAALKWALLAVLALALTALMIEIGLNCAT